MRVFFVRHGEMEMYDPETALMEHGISELGEVQSTLLAERMATLDPVPAVFSGPSKRHLDTATLVSNRIAHSVGRDVGLTSLDGFDDARWGSESLQWAGERSLSQHECIEAMVSDELPVDESFPDVRRRVLETWRGIEETENETVIIVTSAIVVLIVLANVIEIPLDPPRVKIDNTGITEFLLTPDGPRLEQLNSTGHLSRELLTNHWSGY